MTAKDAKYTKYAEIKNIGSKRLGDRIMADRIMKADGRNHRTVGF